MNKKTVSIALLALFTTLVVAPNARADDNKGGIINNLITTIGEVLKEGIGQRDVVRKTKKNGTTIYKGPAFEATQGQNGGDPSVGNPGNSDDPREDQNPSEESPGEEPGE